MSTNLILEQIKRFKLLTTYDSKLTLTENESNIEMFEARPKIGKNQQNLIKAASFNPTDINKAPDLTDLKTVGLGALTDDLFKRQLFSGDNVLKNVGGKSITNSEELIQALNTNTLRAGDYSKVKKTLLKSNIVGDSTYGTLKNTLTDESRDLILNNKGINGLDGKMIPLENIKKGTIKDTLVAKGYNPSAAQEIEDKVLSSQKYLDSKKSNKVTVPDRTATPDGGMPPKDGGRGKAGTDVVDGDGARRRTGTDAVDGGDWKKLDKDGIVVNKNGDVIEIIVNNKIIQTIDNTPFYKRWIKSGKTTWKTILPYLIGAGIGSLLTGFLYGLFSKNGKQYFPQCIGGSIMLNPEALKKTAEAGLSTNQAYMMDPKHPPLMNALVTSTVDGQSGTMELADGRKATYQQKNEAGRNIVEVKDSSGAVVYVIDCSTNVEIKIENPTPTPPPVPVPSGCDPASDFPFGYYQSNPKVTEVQQCVGASQDSCMGPETARGIKSFLGLSQTPTSLTKDIYDQVMAKCGKNTKEETKPKEPEERFGGGTKTFGA